MCFLSINITQTSTRVFPIHVHVVKALDRNHDSTGQVRLYLYTDFIVIYVILKTSKPSLDEYPPYGVAFQMASIRRLNTVLAG